MLKKNLIKAYTLVALAGLPAVLASVPRNITNDTALYQDLHELNVKKIKNVNFDSDIHRLSAQEKSHHEALPVRISGPMSRVQKTPYKYSTRK